MPFVSRGAITKVWSPKAVQTADLDGDGDLDVLTVSEKITWHENVDGQGQFGEQQVIASTAPLSGSAHVADLDRDGDLDVLSVFRALLRSGRLAWYENLDGRGHFSSQRVISPEPVGDSLVAAADLDGDGDNDALSVPYLPGDSKAAWYENLDGRGHFGAQQIIAVDRSASIFVSDLDGDDDLDILAAHSTEIVWNENVHGQARFGPPRTITNSHGANSIFPADLDGDGDLDVLAGGLYSYGIAAPKIVWYENIDGRGNYGKQPRTTAEAYGNTFVCAADLDGDGDLDVLAATKATPTQGGVSWYENTDRHGNLSAPWLVSGDARRAEAVEAADLDGDGDIDVLAALWPELWGGEISWYENRAASGASDLSRRIGHSKSNKPKNH